MLTQPVELKEKINKAKELTEKIYGELPVSWYKLLALFGAVFVSVATICGLLGGFVL